MAPARSIQCIKRPPSRAASGFASLGRTISAISDCESRTGRGASISWLMILFLRSSFFVPQPLQLLRLGPLLCDAVHCLQLPLCQVVFQEALRHLLHTLVGVTVDPSGPAGDRVQKMAECFLRSEEHTSELQSPDHLVFRLLLEKKNVEFSDMRTSNLHGV